ncbi:MAG TPA: flagellar hook-length control protein FliK, partial [Anaerolineae bacterium]|nr:flagellar hook-length control protein FliK [Anaerolineae bacterium]
ENVSRFETGSELHTNTANMESPVQADTNLPHIHEQENLNTENISRYETGSELHTNTVNMESPVQADTNLSNVSEPENLNTEYVSRYETGSELHTNTANMESPDGEAISEQTVFHNRFADVLLSPEGSKKSIHDTLSHAGDADTTEPLRARSESAWNRQDNWFSMDHNHTVRTLDHHTDNSREDTGMVQTPSSGTGHAKPSSGEGAVMPETAIVTECRIPHSNHQAAEEHSANLSTSQHCESELTEQAAISLKSHGYDPYYGISSEAEIHDIHQMPQASKPGFKQLSQDMAHDLKLNVDDILTVIHHTEEKPQLPFISPGSFAEGTGMPQEMRSDILDRIVRYAQIMFQKGQSSAVIKLEPPNLGRLKLEIVTEQSRITGKITVETHEVKEIIQNSLSELLKNLTQHGLKVESFDVLVGHNGGMDAWSRRDDFERMGMHYTKQGGTLTSSTVETPEQDGIIRKKSLHTGMFEVWI